MKKYFVILIVSLIIVILAWLVVFALWLNSFAYSLFLSGVAEDRKITEEDNGTTVAYGVIMKNKCFDKFNNFVNEYGADYSKCLVEYEYKEEPCGGLNPEIEAFSDKNVLVVLDASGSMQETIITSYGFDNISERKIDVAKKVVANFFTKMPEGVNSGLIIYGHKGSNSQADMNFSCQGIEEILKLGQNSAESIEKAMNSFAANGWTPIAGSLDFAKGILKSKNKEDENYIIVISDGYESCGGDPKISAENLYIELPNTKLFVIGFTNNKDISSSLWDIVSYGNGKYASAQNSSQISRLFEEQLFLIKKECITSNISKISFGRKENNIKNLNCWLNAYKKESEDFDLNIIKKSIEDTSCNQEISSALNARHAEFWLKRIELEKKQEKNYKEIELKYKEEIELLEKGKENIFIQSYF